MTNKVHYVAKILFLIVLTAIAAALGWTFGGLEQAVIAGVMAAVSWLTWSAYTTYQMVIRCTTAQHYS